MWMLIMNMEFKCYYGNLNVVQYLLENNFNIDAHALNECGFGR